MTLVNSQRERINVSDSDEVEVKSESNSGSNKESNDELSDLEDDVKSGWADSVAKILKTKKPKGKKTLVLSKARKITDLKRTDPIKPEDIGFQIDGEIKEEKPTLVELDRQGIKSKEPVKKKRKEQASIRIKPDILYKDRERSLTKIATRGVVQLFNAVRMQQKDIDHQLQEAGPLIRKQESVMKNIDKRAFLDILMQKKSQTVDGELKEEERNADYVDGVKKENASSNWNVLRDDFMMSAKLKDWDKELDDCGMIRLATREGWQRVDAARHSVMESQPLPTLVM